MSEKKPRPINPYREPNICPVCGKASYSASGIHPQCAVKKGDQARQEQLKREKPLKKSKAADKPQARTRWQKQCPKCNRALHVRKKVCECGYQFDTDRANPN